HPAREPLVLRADDAIGGVAVLHLPPPVAVDRQDLDVDPFAVDQGNAIGAERAAACLAFERRPFHDLRDTVDRAVRVNVDDGDTLAADRDLFARTRWNRRGAAPSATAAALGECGKLASGDVRASRGTS